LPPALTKLRLLVERGLAETAALWPEVRFAFAWVHQAAAVLKNEPGSSGAVVRRRYTALLRRLGCADSQVGKLHGALRHFVKVTRSYWPGLFACYDVPDLPRTNNALEQFFGSGRYHERRIRGTKAASPGLVLRGSVRLVAGAATRLRAVNGPELAPTDLNAWRTLRDELEQRRAARTQRRRFRRDPTAYLAELEARLPQLVLPA
jgi:hypothetical protein